MYDINDIYKFWSSEPMANLGIGSGD
jgi:hypothetical protein